MTGTQSKTSRARFLDLPDDPEEAFRIRAVADRDALLSLMETIRDGCTPPRMKRCLAELEELAHGLAGTGGVFGFPQVSAFAARLERLTERYRHLDTPLDRRRIARLISAMGTLTGQLRSASASQLNN